MNLDLASGLVVFLHKVSHILFGINGGAIRVIVIYIYPYGFICPKTAHSSIAKNK